jgi:hypothetical protein
MKAQGGPWPGSSFFIQAVFLSFEVIFLSLKLFSAVFLQKSGITRKK